MGLKEKQLLVHVTPAHCFISSAHEHLWGFPIRSGSLPLTSLSIRRTYPQLSHGVFPLYGFYQSSGYWAVSREPGAELDKRIFTPRLPSPRVLAGTV